MSRLDDSEALQKRLEQQQQQLKDLKSSQVSLPTLPPKSPWPSVLTLSAEQQDL